MVTALFAGATLTLGDGSDAGVGTAAGGGASLRESM
jgi:hypothetical protein